ncbi:MAG: hypothetical protein RLZZ360_90 [Candidatus Parcubacteria bacterium]|jgi:putative hydrolase of HD superfamily
MPDLDSLLEFTRLMSKLSTTERFVNKIGTNTRENFSEHCTQLAFTAWYLIEKHKMSLAIEKVLQYALIHDIVETYTGDFPTHLPNCDRQEKERREREAFACIKQDFPDATSLWLQYAQYEQKIDAESKFVYALDKLLPGLNIYLDSGKAWAERDPENNTWSFDDLSKRVAHDQLVSQLWEEIRTRIYTEHPEFFSQP